MNNTPGQNQVSGFKVMLEELRKSWEEQFAEDPFMLWLNRYSKIILLAVVAVVAVMYLKDVYNETQQKSRAAGADVYAQVRAGFDEWSALLTSTKEEDKKKAADLKGKLEGSIQALSDQKEPYRSLAPLYRSMMSIRSGEVGESRQNIPNLSLTDHQQGTITELTTELEMLTVARAQLDGASAQAGKDLLIKLSKEGKFVRSSAAIILAEIAVSEEERTEAAALIDAILAAQPEQTKVLKTAREQLR